LHADAPPGASRGFSRPGTGSRPGGPGRARTGLSLARKGRVLLGRSLGCKGSNKPLRTREAAKGPCGRLSFLRLLCTPRSARGSLSPPLRADALLLRPGAPRDKRRLSDRAGREGPGRGPPCPGRQQRLARSQPWHGMPLEPSPVRSPSQAEGRLTAFWRTGTLLCHAAGARGAPRLDSGRTWRSSVLAHPAHRPQQRTRPHADRQTTQGMGVSP
jgi:hypothetical protein